MIDGGGSDVRRLVTGMILSDDVMEKIRDLSKGRDLSEEPLMILLMRGFFKDEEWVDYLARVVDMEKMVKDFEERLKKHFEVVGVVKIGPFDLAAFVDFKDGTPDEHNLSGMMGRLEMDMIEFLTGPDYLGRIKEQVDILTSPFKSFVDFSIGHAFIRRGDEDGVVTAINVALKDAEARKTSKLSRLTEELLRIIDRQDVQTYFQPIVDLKEKRIFALEALLRGPSSSVLRSPDLMFRIAAYNGLEMELDRLARRKHLERFKEVMNEIDSFLTINLGPLTPVFIDEVDRDMRKLGIPPERVIWEVSERTYVDDFAAFSRVMDFLIKSGYRVAVDDFGAGATSFKLTFSIDANIIKIDRSLIKDVGMSEYKMNLLYKMIQCFYRPNNVLIVEGVETEGELKALLKIGYRYFQGYYFFRPSPKIPLNGDLSEKLKGIDVSGRKIFDLYYEF